MREVTISVKLDDTGSDGAFKRLTARFNELGDVSDRALKGIGSKLENQLIVGLNKGGNREYLETIRRIAPEIKTLHEQIKAGSFDVADYNRRMAMMPGFVRTAMQDVKGLGEAFKQNGKDIESSNNELSKTLIGLNLLERAVDFVKQKISEGRDEFLKFGKEISAIGTIVDDDFDLSKARDQIASLPAALGKSSELANAFKLAVGSGVEAGKALAFTADSAKAAKAGFAGVTETVDASTTILNSYGIQAERVNTVYDMMFQTVKNGKIEFPQLAQSIGQVSNIAAQSGVKLEEMFAVIATATATTKPSVAIEAFRSALSNILKPSQEAAKLAESLGLQFNVSALRAKGFASFLQDVIDKTKGNTDQLAILFGDVQGLNSILSITGAQAQNFSKNLNDMSNASGNVDKAFQKQQQSLSAQIENFGVTFEKRFGTLLSVVEPVLIAVFSAINKYPNAFTAAALVVGALVTAHLLLNTQLVVTASTAIPNLIRGLITTISTMTSFTAATAAGTAGIVAFTAGWGLIVAAIGVAAYALYNYSQSQKQTVEDQLKGIEAAKAQVDSLNQQKQTLSNLQSGVGDLSNSQQQLTDIYATLSSASLDRVNAATKEKGAVSALADEIERLNKAKGVELEVQVIALVDRAAKAYEEQKIAVARAEEATKTYQNAIGNLTPVMEVNAKTGLETGRVITTVKEQYDQLGVRQNQTAAESREAEKAFNEVKAALDRASQSMGMTTIEFINAKVATGQLNLQQADFLKSLSSTGAAQDTFADKTKGTTDALDEQRKAVFDLRMELQKLANYDQEKVDRSIFDIVKLTKTKAEASALARKTLENSPDFRKMIEENKAANERAKAVQDVYQPADRSTSTRSTRTRAGNSINELLPSSGRGYTTYGRSGNDQYGTRQMIQNIEEIGRAWERLSKTVIQVGDISRKGGGAFAPHATHRTGDMADIRPFRKDGKMLPTNISDPQYDRETTRQFILLIRKMMPDANVLFNDPQFVKAGLTKYAKGHDNHLHINRLGAGKASAGGLDVLDKEAQTMISIAEARARINQLVTQGGDAHQRELDSLTQYENNLKQIERLVEQINENGLVLTAALPDTQEDAKNMVERFQSLLELQNTLKSEKASSGKQYFDLTQQMTDGLSDLEKFDYQLAQLRKTSKLTSDDFLFLADNIEEVRSSIQKVSELKASQKLADEAKTISNTLTKMVNDYRGQLDEIFSDENIKPFAAFLDQLQGLNELDLPTEAFAELKRAISPDGIDVEKLIAIAKVWLELSAAIGGTDANKVDEILNKIRLAAEGFNNLTDAQKRDKNAEDFNSLSDSLKNEYEQLIRNGREWTTYEQVLHDLNTTYKDLSASEKENLLLKAQQIDAQRKYNEIYNETYNLVRESLDILTEEGKTFSERIGGFFKNIADRFKQMLLDLAAQWLTSKIFKILNPNSGGNSSGSGGGFFDLFKGIFGGGGSGSSSSGGSGGLFGIIKNFIRPGSSSGAISSSGGIQNTLVTPDGKTFSTGGLGGLFAPQKNILTGKNSQLAGIIGGVGSLVSLAGGIIGGRVGGVLQSAGTGAQIGAMFGPWGAAIGAGIGLIAGLFGGDPKRKRDKNEKLPQLNKLFADSLQQLRELGANKSAFFDNPEGVMAKAVELRAQIASGGNIVFESKKYQKESQKLIASKLIEADAIIAGLEKIKDRAMLARDVDTRLQTRFATGVYLDSAFSNQYQDFKRRNGMLAGTFTGKDYLPSLLADGEMVLNAKQIKKVKENAGFDAFHNAGIPGYAGGTYVQPSPSAPASITPIGNAPTIIVQPNITIVVEGEGISDAQIKNVLVEGLKSTDVQVKLVDAYDKEKLRRK